MKAVIVEKPGVLCTIDVPCPHVGDYDLLCQVLYCTTCTGTDLHLVNGTYPFPIEYPILLGHENIGRVVTVGKKVKYVREGDLVARVGVLYGPYRAKWGGFVEFGLAKDFRAMKEDGLRPIYWQAFTAHQVIPQTVDAKVGVMMTQWRETLSYFMRMGIPPGGAILIIGSGGNGLSFAVHAKHHGVADIVMVGNRGRHAAALSSGVTGYHDYQASGHRHEMAGQYVRGFAAIIDTIGKKESLNPYLPLLKPAGIVAIFGIDEYGAVHIDAQQACGTFTVYDGGYNEGEAHADVVDRIERGWLDLHPWLDPDHVFGFDEITDAFAMVGERRAVKVLLQPLVSA